MMHGLALHVHEMWVDVKIKEGIEDDNDNDEEVEAYNLSLTEYLQCCEKTYIGCLNKRIQFRGKPKDGLGP